MIRYALLAIVLGRFLTFVPPSHAKGPPKPPARPNILFIIMDDVGIDQVPSSSTTTSDNQPQTPTIDQLADAGVNFRNAWSMPACSTSRAVFFTGRFPFRTHVYGALGPEDLANSMVSHYETTAPKLLAKRGYESALFGKFHIALQGNDPAGYRGASQPRLELLRGLVGRDRRSVLDRQDRRRCRSSRQLRTRAASFPGAASPAAPTTAPATCPTAPARARDRRRGSARTNLPGSGRHPRSRRIVDAGARARSRTSADAEQPFRVAGGVQLPGRQGERC